MELDAHVLLHQTNALLERKTDTNEVQRVLELAKLKVENSQAKGVKSSNLEEQLFKAEQRYKDINSSYLASSK